MSFIRILPDNLVNQIAAGEVVERPASVVKELVENALDAGATRVVVELWEGGREGIVVADDGCGMDGDDLLLALERHATSKIQSSDDLSAIGTLGFRGEALPAIASVGRMTLASRPVDAPQGMQVRVEGGRYAAADPCGLAQGTRVEVRDLFFNLPARRKFLKSPATELSHAVQTLEHYALARPETAFRLAHEGRDILNLPPARDAGERFFALFPEFPQEDFTPMDLAGASAHVRGLVGRPDRNLGSPRYLFTLVNGRFVRDRLLQSALAQGYRDTLPRGRHPAALVLLDVALGRVDVNVHPAKREVRFLDGSAIHDLVTRAIRGAIAPHTSPGVRPDDFGSDGLCAGPASVAEEGAIFSNGAAPAQGAPFQPSFHLPEVSPLRVLGQWRSSFILCDSPEGLAVVDQHVAHERVRFEEFRRFLDTPGPRQAFLEPHLYHLHADLAHRAAEVSELLTAQGFETEPLGEGAVAVRSAPAFLTHGEAQSLLTDFIREAGDALKTPRDRWREVLIMRSCRGSVMLRDPLPMEAMQRLLDRLHSLHCPLTCPHGRPIVFILRTADLMAKFGR
jgi:DNA mismatch repair protein MutL